ncbi:MAG: hypothetical protein SGBAC_010109 [Bacillariaceae sp.]
MKSLERLYKHACSDYRKALENQEQVQLQLVKSQRCVDETFQRKTEILGQMAGNKYGHPTVVNSRSSPNGGRKLGHGIGNGNTTTSRLLGNNPNSPTAHNHPKIGERIRKKFGRKYYKGRITALPEPHSQYYHVSYDDGDEEDISVCELNTLILDEEEEEKGDEEEKGSTITSRMASPIFNWRPKESIDHAKRPVSSISIVGPQTSAKYDDNSSKTEDEDSTNRKVASLVRRNKKPKVCLSSPMDMLVSAVDDRKAVGSPKPTPLASIVTDIETSPPGKAAMARRAQAGGGKATATTTTTITTAAGGSTGNLEWLNEFQVYLQETALCVPPQGQRIVGQIRKLVTGGGIEYHRWPKGIAFWKGKSLDLDSTNLNELEQEARDFEDQYGADMGNGFLLRVPIHELKCFVAHQKLSKMPQKHHHQPSSPLTSSNDDEESMPEI